MASPRMITLNTLHSTTFYRSGMTMFNDFFLKSLLIQRECCNGTLSLNPPSSTVYEYIFKYIRKYFQTLIAKKIMSFCC